MSYYRHRRELEKSLAFIIFFSELLDFVTYSHILIYLKTLLREELHQASKGVYVQKWSRTLVRVAFISWCSGIWF